MFDRYGFVGMLFQSCMILFQADGSDAAKVSTPQRVCNKTRLLLWTAPLTSALPALTRGVMRPQCILRSLYMPKVTRLPILSLTSCGWSTHSAAHLS